MKIRTDIQTVAVIGAGAMGNGIAHTFAQYGFEVLLIDTQQEFLNKAIATITKNSTRQVEKGAISPIQQQGLISRIFTSTQLMDIKSADLVIEAITENEAAKLKLFRMMDKLCPGEVVFCSNTSTILIERLATVTVRPRQVIGMHFMNPVPMMKLVEVAQFAETDKETVKLVTSLAKKLGKTPVVVQSSSGFVVNRVLMPFLNEAIFCVQDGTAAIEGIDTCVCLGLAHPMGPLTLADHIGLDVVRSIMEIMCLDSGDNKYSPCPLLIKMTDADMLGNKTSQTGETGGFYKNGLPNPAVYELLK